MVKSDFHVEINKNDDLKEQIPLFSNLLNDSSVTTELYNLCRKTFEAQFNAKIGKTEKGYVCEINKSSFDEVKSKMKTVTETVLNKDMDKEIFNELIFIMKAYYFKTGSTEEIESKTFVDTNQQSSTSGYFGTYYNLLQIDWDYFIKGLES